MGIVGNSTKYEEKGSLRRAVFCFFTLLSPLELNINIFQSSIENINQKKGGCLILNLRHPLFYFFKIPAYG